MTPDRVEAERLLNGAQADLESAVKGDPSLASAYSLLSHLFYQRQDNISVVLAARRAYEEDAFLENADLIVQRLFCTGSSRISMCSGPIRIAPRMFVGREVTRLGLGWAWHGAPEAGPRWLYLSLQLLGAAGS